MPAAPRRVPPPADVRAPSAPTDRWSRRRCGLALASAALLVGCRPRPYDLAAHGPDLAARVITRARAGVILDALPPEALRRLEQLMFLVELPTASGNEQRPLTFFRRVEQELTPPLAVTARDVDVILGDMLAILRKYSESATGTTNRGYDIVTEMLGPALGVVPSPGDALRAIQRTPSPYAAAFLIQEYFADHHYHAWNMKETLIEALLAGSYGPAPLEAYADYLQERFPSRRPSSVFHRVVEACQRELQDEFYPWYRSVRGRSYGVDTFRR